MPCWEFMRKKFDLSLLPPFPDLQFENEIWDAGFASIAGIDEAGRGALAGPVYAGAVMLPNNLEIQKRLDGVNDSKKLSLKKREYFYKIIKDVAISVAVGKASAKEIDKIGIVPATHLAARRALTKLTDSYEHLLVDAFTLTKVDTPQTVLIKGDARSLSIACASILAKVSRDRAMIKLDSKFPQYGFAKHKGYGTKVHRKAIEEIGGCKVHRTTFAPLRYQYEILG